jgi:hypothetical protein
MPERQTAATAPAGRWPEADPPLCQDRSRLVEEHNTEARRFGRARRFDVSIQRIFKLSSPKIPQARNVGSPIAGKKGGPETEDRAGYRRDLDHQR